MNRVTVRAAAFLQVVFISRHVFITFSSEKHEFDSFTCIYSNISDYQWVFGSVNVCVCMNGSM